MDVPSAIRYARTRAGISQAEVARRAKTSQPAVARYEAGGSTPSLRTLERLLVACGSSVELAARSKDPPRRPDAAAAHDLRASLRRSRGRLHEIARRHGVRNIRVFGSVARRTERTGSDIDLLVELDPDRTLLDLIGFEQDVEAALGVRVDAVAPRFMRDRVRKHALRDARPV